MVYKKCPLKMGQCRGAETIEPSTEVIMQNKEASAETIESSTGDEHK